MKKLVVATRNPGKLAEIKEALEGLGLEILCLADFPEAPEVVEDGTTFLENAKKKALAAARHTGLPALADDSGLVVDAIAPRPGVHSARFAGDNATDLDNNRKLLETLKSVPEPKRTARFVCVMVVAFPDGELVSAEGTCEGIILQQPRGEQGFGYDPLFYYPPLGKTFAELAMEEKLKVSHRGAALRKLRGLLDEKLRSR